MSVTTIASMLVGPVADLLGKFIPDKDKAAALAHDIATMAATQAHDVAMAQMTVNKQEAAHKSLFVAGWRPAVGWLCASALAMNYVITPVFGPLLEAYTEVNMVPLDLNTMMPILLGMLGMVGMRTIEKRSGVAREK